MDARTVFCTLLLGLPPSTVKLPLTKENGQVLAMAASFAVTMLILEAVVHVCSPVTLVMEKAHGLPESGNQIHETNRCNCQNHKQEEVVVVDVDVRVVVVLGAFVEDDLLEVVVFDVDVEAGFEVEVVFVLVVVEVADELDVVVFVVVVLVVLVCVVVAFALVVVLAAAPFEGPWLTLFS